MTTLLAEDGRASMATMMMMSHFAFRRDAARFARALAQLEPGDTARAEALKEEWSWYRGGLHHHHEMEDTGIFPGFAKQQESLQPVIEELSAQHRLIDPLLERGDRAFATLPNAEAVLVANELCALLDQHLTLEEANVIPLLRDAHAFPLPPDDAAIAMYAQGFAWSSNGIADEVLDKVYALLPESLTSRIPAARSEFAARCVRVWGTAEAGQSRTSVPG